MTVHCFGEFELDTGLYELRQRDETLDTGARVFDVLAYLIEHRDRLVSKDELIQRVWGVAAMSGSSVPTCIAAVRKALGDDPASPQFIETQRGRGYRFIAEVTQRFDPTETASAGAPASLRAVAVDAGHTIFVDRESELAALYAAFERTLSGAPQLVLVTGEPGIGKTRLIEEFSSTTRDDGAVVLLGRAIEGEGAPAFWPWVQIIRTCVDFSDSASLPAALGPLLSSLLQMVPELSGQFPDVPPPPKLDPDQARFRMFDAVTALLTRTASERPLVLLLDDLHRADPASLRLLQFATRELREAPVLFLGTYRDAEIHSDAGHARMLSDLAREEPTRCINLGGLTRQGVAKFVWQSAPQAQAPSNALVSALYDQTGGNPFFLTQLVHLLTAEGRLDDFDADAPWKIHLPGGIRDAVGRQLDGLPETTRETLAVAAVAGREFENAVIASASNADPTTTFARLQPALEAKIVVSVPGRLSRYRFSHVILRDCIYDALPTLERTSLHQRIGEALETFHAGQLSPRAAELAYHFYEAVPTSGPERAIAYSLEAARAADSRLAYEDVPGYYRRALMLVEQKTPPDLLEQAKLLIALGESEIRAGDRGPAQQTFKSAVSISREINEPEILARAALGLAPGFFAIEVGVYDPVLVSLLEEALRVLPPGDSAIRAQVIARLSVALLWAENEDRRFQLSTDALDMANRVNDIEARARALSARHESLWGSVNFEERLKTIEDIEALSHLTDDPEIHLNHWLLKTTALLESGDIELADEAIMNYRKVAIETRQPRFLWYIELFATMRHLMRGDFRSASISANYYKAIGEHAKDTNAYLSYGTHMAMIGWEKGRARDILPSVDAFISNYPAITAWRCVRIFLNSEIGRLKQVRRDYELFASSDFSTIRANPNRLVCLSLLAEACFTLNDKNRAQRLYDLLLPEKHRFAIIGYSTGFFGSVSERLGLLSSVNGDYDRSLRHLHDALLSYKEIEASPWACRAHYHLALLTGSRTNHQNRSEASKHLHECEKTCRDLGLTHLQAKLKRLTKIVSGNPAD